MKKMYFFLLLAGLFTTQAFAQNEDENAAVNESSSEGTTSGIVTSPSGLGNNQDVFGTTAKVTKCGVCGRWHYPVCTPPPPTPTSVPIDGGLSVLLAAGAAYGIRRKRQKALAK